MRAVSALIAVSACGLALGCASYGAIVSAGAIDSGRIMATETVVVAAESDLPESDPARSQLQFQIASGLERDGDFERVVESGPPPDVASYLLVKARIAELDQVSQFARAMVGALAGRASILVDVEVSQQPEGSAVAAFQAEAKSSAGWSGAGITDQVVWVAAEQIVAKILEGGSARDALRSDHP